MEIIRPLSHSLPLNDTPIEGQNCVYDKLPTDWVDSMLSIVKNPTGQWSDYNRALRLYRSLETISGQCCFISVIKLGDKPNPAGYLD